MEILAYILAAVVLAAIAAVALKREDLGLRRRARRYRQLELEGIEELRGRADPYPEQRAVEGGFLREPNGSRADPGVLREELRRAREHMRKGAPCLL